MTTGQRIKQLRKENGMTLQDLVDALNKRYHVELLKSSISMYENDQRLPTTETCDALADYFRVSLDWLRCRSDVRNPDEQLAALNYPADVQDLAKRLSSFPNGLRRDFVEYSSPLIDKLSEVHTLLESQLESLRAKERKARMDS